MSDTLIHDHGCDLDSKWYIRNLVNEVDFELGPLLFVNSELEVKLNTESVELANFKVVILFSISSLNADCQSISFSEVINIDDE